MYFSASTIALVASVGFGLVDAAAVERSDIQERGLSLLSVNLFNLPYYGAVGKPWQKTSSPGSFCSSKKPSNSPAWQQIPMFDGADFLKCNKWWNQLVMPLCSSGNKRKSLPSGCKPPHKNTPKPSPPPGTTKVILGTTKVIPGTTTVVAPTTTVVAGTTTAVPATTTVVPATTVVVPPTTTIITGTAAPTPTVDPNPYNDPVCQGQYQTHYLNYTIVAPNGVWAGLTVGAAPQDDSYMTYTLANTIDECLNACSKFDGCVSVNTYYDTNPTETDLAKHAPGVLTCAMFSKCVETEKNDNFGGQDDPNIIEQSNGYCRSGACDGP